jgi:hypothetical protein
MATARIIAAPPAAETPPSAARFVGASRGRACALARGPRATRRSARRRARQEPAGAEIVGAQSRGVRSCSGGETERRCPSRRGGGQRARPHALVTDRPRPGGELARPARDWPRSGRHTVRPLTHGSSSRPSSRCSSACGRAATVLLFEDPHWATR